VFARAKESSFRTTLKEKLRRLAFRQDRKPIFAGKFLSDGSKVIQTARNKPQRRQKVKPRQRIVVAKRQKVRRAVSLVIELMISGAAAAALVASVAHFLFTSPRFAVAHIGVTGNKNVTAQTIIEHSGLSEEQNIFEQNIARAAAAITELPRVHSVAVQRKLPDEIKIEIEERQPVALVLAKELLLLDRERKIIDTFDSSDSVNLPVITGKALTDIKVGDTVEADGIEQAIQIIDQMAEFQTAGMMSVSEINIDNPENIVLIAEHTGTSIYMGSKGFRDKLWRLAQVGDEIKRNERLRMTALERVDMRFESIIPAKFSDS
jgi:cell division protein FtsQ